MSNKGDMRARTVIVSAPTDEEKPRLFAIDAVAETNADAIKMAESYARVFYNGDQDFTYQVIEVIETLTKENLAEKLLSVVH